MNMVSSHVEFCCQRSFSIKILSHVKALLRTTGKGLLEEGGRGGNSIRFHFRSTKNTSCFLLVDS